MCVMSDMEYYLNPDKIKERFKKEGEFQNLKSKLDNDGIIFEYDCNGLVTSVFIENSNWALERLLIPECADDSSCRGIYLRGAVECEGSGWHYYLYDSRKLDMEEAQAMAEKKFKINM